MDRSESIAGDNAMKMNEKQLCTYIEAWMAERYPEWIEFRKSVTDCRQTGIYLIPGGNDLMDIIRSVISILEDRFGLVRGQHLIPTKFSSPHLLIRELSRFRDYAKREMPIVNDIPAEYQDRYEVRDTYDMLEDIYEMASYCIQSYEVSIIDNTYIKPYLDMKACLDSEQIKEFVAILYSIFNNLPYSIHKGKVNEAFFHSITYAVMYQLGFECLPEKPTCRGRMDMWLKMKQRIYIFEFKYSAKDKDMSKEAIRQIKDRQYADPYLIKKKKVIAVGVTYGKGKRNVIGSDSEVLTAK